jgi:hypothetical protein
MQIFALFNTTANECHLIRVDDKGAVGYCDSAAVSALRLTATTLQRGS